MRNFTRVTIELIAAAIIGLTCGVIGAKISNIAAYQIFEKQLLCSQYSIFAEDIQAAYKNNSMWKSRQREDLRKNELKEEAELYLNRAWARALVTLPDEAFSEINTMVKRGTVDAGIRNRVYYILRKQLYPNTSIKYDDIMTTNIELKE